MADHQHVKPQCICPDTIFKYTLSSLSGNSGGLTVVRLQQPQEQRYLVKQVHAGSFRVSLIHRNLTRTAGTLTCVRDHSYDTHGEGWGWGGGEGEVGVGQRLRTPTTFLTRKKLTIFACAPDGGFEPPVLMTKNHSSQNGGPPRLPATLEEFCQLTLSDTFVRELPAPPPPPPPMKANIKRILNTPRMCVSSERCPHSPRHEVAGRHVR